MSPEQIREELVDHRTDLYSLGVVMYQMLTGKLPFQGSNKFSIIYQITQHEPAPPSSHRRGVPEALDRIVRRAMQKDAAARYHSGDEFADELVGALRSGQRRGAARELRRRRQVRRAARDAVFPGLRASRSCGKWCASASGSASRPAPTSCVKASRATSSACSSRAKRASPRTASS